LASQNIRADRTHAFAKKTKRKIQVTPVILCDDSGTRLWTLYRTGFPKQFLCLTGKKCLFQQAEQRLAGSKPD
jgi:mannose-1-phosphate guanylyltransferase/mannose-6-phosphate isomerase